MPKHKWHSNLAARSAAVATLAVTITAFGCTTNRTPGDGDPVTARPAVGGTTAPNTGSSGGTSPVPPPLVSARDTTSADRAAAIMAQHQPLRGTVLGPVDPAPTASRGATPPTGQFVNPAMYENPATVNSTITSRATPAIVSGAGEPVGGLTDADLFFADVLNEDGAVIGPATLPPTAATTPGVTIAPTGAVTPTTAAIPATPGMFAGTGTTVAPVPGPGLAAATTAAGATPATTATVATMPPVTAATSSAVAAPTTSAQPAQATAPAVSLADRAAAMSSSRTASGSVRVTTGEGGAVVVTNQPTTSRFNRLMRALRLNRSTTPQQ